MAGIDAQNTDFTAVTSSVTLKNLDRRGLARPVRTEQRKDLALTDTQVDASDDLGIRIELHEPTHIDCERSRAAVLSWAGVEDVLCRY